MAEGSFGVDVIATQPADAPGHALPVVQLEAPTPEPQLEPLVNPLRRGYISIGWLLMLNVLLGLGGLHVLGVLSLPFLSSSDEVAVPEDPAAASVPQFVDAAYDETGDGTAAEVTDETGAEAAAPDASEPDVAASVSALAEAGESSSAGADSGATPSLAGVAAPLTQPGVEGLDLRVSLSSDGSLIVVGSVPDRARFDDIVARVAEALPSRPATILGIVDESPEASADFGSIRVPVGDPLLFDEGSSRMTAAHAAGLDLAAAVAASLPQTSIVVTGHASPEGDTAFNLRLSTERVASVVAHLLSAGLTEDRIVTVAAGESPVAAEADYPQSRRVDIELDGLFDLPEAN